MGSAPVTVRWGRADVRALRRFALMHNRWVLLFAAVFAVSWPLGLAGSPVFFLVTVVTAPMAVRLAITALVAGRDLDRPSMVQVDGQRLRVTSSVASSSRREWVIDRVDIARVVEHGRLLLIHLAEGQPRRLALPRLPIAEHPEVLAAIRGLARS